jgi:hypothetical protein
MGAAGIGLTRVISGEAPGYIRMVVGEVPDDARLVCCGRIGAAVRNQTASEARRRVAGESKFRSSSLFSGQN